MLRPVAAKPYEPHRVPPHPHVGRHRRHRAHPRHLHPGGVVGTRPDGFHELRTVFQAISLHDTITCIPRPGPFAIECDVAGVPLDRSNLIWKAADALWRSLRRSGPLCDVAIRLDKAFGGGAETRFRIQTSYDLAQAMKRADEIKVERVEPKAA